MKVFVLSELISVCVYINIHSFVNTNDAQPCSHFSDLRIGIPEPVWASQPRHFVSLSIDCDKKIQRRTPRSLRILK